MIVVGSERGFQQMEWQERIVVDPEILVGKPVVKGTRLSVEFLLGLLAAGWEYQQVLENYPGLTNADLAACIAYAHEAISGEQVYTLSA